MSGDISYNKLKEQILELFRSDSLLSFNEVALDVFIYQAENCPIYKQYLELLSCDIQSISYYEDIPLLPISFFKSQEIKTGSWSEETCFRSSGTKDMTNRSKHFVKNIEWYDTLASNIFESRFGSLESKTILGLLPAYSDNPDSSLVHMVERFCNTACSKEPYTYLYDFEALAQRLKQEKDQGNKLVLFGVTFALLDFSENYMTEDIEADIIFTGGMKNRRKEISTHELISKLETGFPRSNIYSEYGMTELLSQCYGANGLYKSASTIRMTTKEINDPLSNCAIDKQGILGIIDLGNIDSCSFILTEDKGSNTSQLEFTVDGRLSDSELRGCHLLYSPDTP